MSYDENGKPTRLARSKSELWRTYINAANLLVGVLVALRVFGLV